MAEKKHFDIAIIGAGPGGYVAAIKAAQLGLKVALIEKNDLGGTCLNVGCIPTKTLIAHAEVLHTIQKAKEFGIETGKISFNFQKMKERKDKVVLGIRKSLENLLLQNQITILSGEAKYTSPKEIKVQGKDNLIVTCDKSIIATGSNPLDIPSFRCDHKKILNSTSILELTELPKKIAVIGGGYIGCEFASLYQAFGVEVTILEALPSILTTQPKNIAETMTQIFLDQGIKILTNVFVEGIDTSNNNVKVKIKGGNSIDADLALVSVGRSLNTKNLGLEKTGVIVDERGQIPTNSKMETNVDGIYAIGDVTGKFQLAHVASHQAVVAALNASGKKSVMHYEAVPAVVFTHPEIATVGYSLEDALKKGHNAKASKYPFQALGKSQATGETIGFCQVVADSKTGQILGAQVIGHSASILIAEMALAIQNELTIESIMDTIHAHPTTSEGWLESVYLVNDTPIHYPPKKKK